MRVFVLEDDDHRFSKIKRGLIGYEVVRAATAKDAINILEDQLFDLIMLDHDLAAEHYEAYQLMVMGQNVETMLEPTGMRVAEWLAENKKLSTVVVHSLNTIEGPKMADLLEKAGYAVVYYPNIWGVANECCNTIPEVLMRDV